MDERPHLKAILKPLHVGSLALGCIIGFGCFVLPGDFLARAGPLGASLGVLLGGLAMLVIARSYGLMVRTFPVAGAEFAYAYYAGGRYHAYVCGWFLTLGYLSIVPLNATALGVLGKFLVPDLFARVHLYSIAGFDVFGGEILLASAAIAVVGCLHYRGVRDVGNLQVAMTGLLVAGVLAIGLGTPLASGTSVAHWEPSFPGDRAPLVAILAMFAISPWLYVGFDTLPQAAEEFDFSPRQGLGLMVVSIAAGALMYVTLILATAMVVPWQELLAGTPLWATGSAVRTSLGSAGLAVLTVAVAMAVFTGINGFYMASSRLIFSMGRARLLPAWFARIHPTRGTPHNAILFVGLVSLLAPWFGRKAIVWVVDMAAVGTAFGYAYTCFAAYRVAREVRQAANPSTTDPTRTATRGDRPLALLGAALSLGFIALLCVPGAPAFMAIPSWLALGAWTLLGLAFYRARAADYRSLPQSELDRLILQR